MRILSPLAKMVTFTYSYRNSASTWVIVTAIVAAVIVAAITILLVIRRRR